MATRFIPNPAAVPAILRTARLAVALRDIADDIVDDAKAIAPVDENDYRNGIESGAGIENGQAVARVNATDYKSGWIEFGTGGESPTPTFAPLRKAAAKTGKLRAR